MTSGGAKHSIDASDLLELDAIVSELRGVRAKWRRSQQRLQEIGGRELPSREVLGDVMGALCKALFPMRLGPPDLLQENEDAYISQTLEDALGALALQVQLELRHRARLAGGEPGVDIEQVAFEVVRKFARSLPSIREILDSDVLAAFHGDPAAHSVDEVLLCYPGIGAMIHHRIAHQMYHLGAPLLARLVAEIAHSETGIDIHPGASIGPGFFIDHGTGVVIGETARIGSNVRLYQAVTLGAKRFSTDAEGHLKKGLERHPIVEDDVVIYAGATILGRVTIGRGSVIGGNVWLTHSVPPQSHISQAVAQDDRVIEGAVTRPLL